MWEQVKRAIVESSVEGKNPKSEWWNDEVKAAVRRKELLIACVAKERCMKPYTEEKRKVKRCIYQSKMNINELFRRKMNEDVNGNIKLFWKEMNNLKGGKVENWSRIKDENGRLVQEEDEVQRIWKSNFKICII